MENQTQLENILSFFRNYNVISENVKYESGYPNIKPNVLVKFVAHPDGVDVLNGSNGQKILFLKKEEINSINIVDDSNPKRLVFSIYQDSENYNINFVSSGKNAGQTFVDIKHNILQLWKIAEERDINEEIKNYNEKANKENSKNFGIGCLIICIALLAFVIYYFSTNNSTESDNSNLTDSAIVSFKETPVDLKPLSKDEIKEMERKAALQSVKDRKQFGKDFENKLLDKGLNIKVTVSGKNNDKITLRYIRFDEVWRRKFETEGYFDELHSRGFRDIILTDGYDYTEGVRYDK